MTELTASQVAVQQPTHTAGISQKPIGPNQNVFGRARDWALLYSMTFACAPAYMFLL